MSQFTQDSSDPERIYRPRFLQDEDDRGPEPWLVRPDERIGPTLGRRRKGMALSVGVAMLVAIGGGMALLDDRVRPALEHIFPKSASIAERKPAPADQPLAGLPTAGSSERGSAAPAGTAYPPAAAASEPSTPGGVMAELAVPAPTGADLAEPAEPLPPPSIDKDDPYQARALAAGLHPGLSRMLLMRLTPEDYRNAGVAIRTALAETRDGEALLWPKQPAAGLAQFRVHFVRGAQDCRRYVVAVSLDRWATTALPMEKCGARLVEPKPR